MTTSVSEIATNAVVPALIAALRDGNEDVRFRAVEGLGLLKGRRFFKS